MRKVLLIREIHPFSEKDRKMVRKVVKLIEENTGVKIDPEKNLNEEWERIRKIVHENIISRLNPKEVKLYRDSLTNVYEFREIVEKEGPEVFRDLLNWGVEPVETEDEDLLDLDEDLDFLWELFSEYDSVKLAKLATMPGFVSHLVLLLFQNKLPKDWEPPKDWEKPLPPESIPFCVKEKFRPIFQEVYRVLTEKLLSFLATPGSRFNIGIDTISIRDKYVATQIDDTLDENEVGLLFMGGMHRVENFLKLYHIDCEIIGEMNYEDPIYEAYRENEKVRKYMEEHQSIPEIGIFYNLYKVLESEF